MNNSPFNREHLFIPAIVVSVVIHGVMIGASGWIPKAPKFAVLNAPSSLEVTALSQPYVSVLEEEIVTKEFIQPDDQMMFRDQADNNRLTEEPLGAQTEKTMLKHKPLPSVASLKSEGALSEAKPMMQVNPAPMYPQLARQRGWEGIVRLEVLVDGEGTPSRVEVQESSGHSLLDRAALKAVRQWKFLPASSGPVRFSSTITIPIQFNLVQEP